MKPALTLKSTQSPRLFLGLPTYCGQRFNTMTVVGAVQSQQSFSRLIVAETDSSLLASSFNHLLNLGIQYKNEGKADWFLLLHADVIAMDQAGWLDTFWKARCAADADVLSAVLPLKDQRGLTSTALETKNLYAPRRLTMREIARQTETFTDDALLVNTGMLMLNLRAPWIEQLCFTIGDKFITMSDGRRAVGVTPEDWDISRQLKSHGAKLWATTAVKLMHVGRFTYPNFGEWGTDTEDQGDMRHPNPSKSPVEKMDDADFGIHMGQVK